MAAGLPLSIKPTRHLFFTGKGGVGKTSIACATAVALADAGKRVICAGLDTDYRGLPFEPMPQLLAVAEYIDKTLAICVRCGNPAKHTQRIVDSSELVLVGEYEAYEPRCRVCFVPPQPHPPTNEQLSLTPEPKKG